LGFLSPTSVGVPAPDEGAVPAIPGSGTTPKILLRVN
jgi:hypothetical protein